MLDVLINNERYVKQNETKTLSIGVGITTHNRGQLASQTIQKILDHTPNAKVVVVDDASKEHFKHNQVNVYRFNENVGIARAKNKCLELLSDCDHIFLFDDDTYPIVEKWYEPYVNSPEHHLMYLFENWANGRPVGDDHLIYKDSQITAHHHARGCMLYVDSVALATVGGMDTNFGKAMNEHLDWSMRIHNAGLTTFCYMDVLDSDKLIYSSDQHQSVKTSIENRTQNRENNEHLLAKSATSSEYIGYGKSIVLSCYFTGVTDPQRNDKWTPDFTPIKKLKNSVEAKGYEFVLIHDCFDMPNKVTISESPYFERWLKQWQYLRDRRDIKNVFVVDATDVDMTNNPFDSLKDNMLYIGDEPGNTLNDGWMLSRHQEPMVNGFLRANGTLPLLNCGVVGGNRKLVMSLCRDIYEYHFKHPQDLTEMGIFNYLAYSKYADLIEYGRHVTSLFKKYEAKTDAWFRHK